MHSVENSYFYPSEDLDLDKIIHEIILFKILPFKVLPTLHFVIFNF